MLLPCVRCCSGPRPEEVSQRTCTATISQSSGELPRAIFASKTLIFFLSGDDPPKKNTHPNKNTVSANNFGQFLQTFPLKIGRKRAERVCPNCLCKLFLFGWMFLGGLFQALGLLCPQTVERHLAESARVKFGLLSPFLP